MHRYFLVIASLLLFLFDCAAQADSMLSVAGKVKDPAGEAVSNAEVLLLNSQQTVLGEKNTDTEGAFSFENVVPGSYLLVVKSGVFKEIKKAVIVANESVYLEIPLEMAEIREAVTVTAQTGRVEEKNKVPQQVNVISEEQILERAPTVVAQIAQEEVGLYVQRTSPTVSAIFIRGLTGTKVNAFVDGVRYTTSAQRGGVNTFFNMLEPSFLQGAEILRGPNSAQYGSDALGGSVQFQSRNPFLSIEKGWGSKATAFYNDADHGYGANFGSTYKKDSFAFLIDVAGRRANTTRPGEGIDSHNAVTRFFDISSDFAIDGRLPETEFTQYGGMVKTVWSPSTGSFVTANYIRTQTDDGKRYDQLIGGDGNLIADLRDFSLDLFYLKYEKLALGWFDSLTATYSFNSQHEERVNQGGDGNPRANINFEPERTNANGIQAQLSKQLGISQSLLFGAEFYHERVDAPSESLNPTTDIFAIRRGRVPDNARYNSWGIYAQDVIDMIPEKLSFTGNVRYSGVSYKSRASDAPVSSSGEPLWPDDSFDTGYGSFRAGIIYSPYKQWSLMANFSSGFRAPNITDLGTLGLTGSGFEVDAAEVAGLGATIGSTAGSSAVSTGLPVTQLTSETSLNYEFGTRFSNERFETEIVFFLTDIGDNIAKQALILPQGAVGLTLGDEVITSQNGNGVVFVSASTTPVLVRANFDDARLYGIEFELEAQLSKQWSMEGGFTYVHAEDRRSGLPPNIEGGTPAPNGYLKVRYSALNKPFWIEPYILGATKQDRLSSLDLEDRRTGAGRSVSSITNFFRNGATVRGFIGPGADGVLGNSDDVLIATGETLNEVLLRVLGPGLLTSSLFTELPAYLLVNVRFGFQFGGNELLVDFQNITDQNFRGISWGMDGPGRGIYVRYLTRF